MTKIADLAAAIGPDRIHLNTAVRPPTEEIAVPLQKKRMEQLKELFKPQAEVVAEFSVDCAPDTRANEGTILAMVQRRPFTADEIDGVFGMHINEVSKYVGKLMRTEQIRSERKDGMMYYVEVSRQQAHCPDV